ncbi:hypothetical protein DRQ26_01035 [bacterium]|nr:MAG: hypothetical protein DRQ26_01035 [bacterium]
MATNDIIYIPFNPDDLLLYKQRKKLLKEFMEEGWVLSGTTKIKDELGEEIHIWILNKRE